MDDPLGVSRPIYVNVDSLNLDFPYFYFLGGYKLRKNTMYIDNFKILITASSKDSSLLNALAPMLSLADVFVR